MGRRKCRFVSKPAAWAAALVASLAAGLAASPARAAWPPSGLPLATRPGQQARPLGLTGPDGELHAFWVEPGHATYALWSQRLTLKGEPASGWPAGGRGVVTTPAVIGSPVITADGAGGAILAWYDSRSTGGPRGIYTVRVNDEAAIVPGFSITGTPICTLANGPLNDLMALCSDGAGGAFVAWTDARNTPPQSVLVYDVFAHHVLADGSLDPAWPAEGRALTSGAGYKYPHALVPDGSGGFWLATENPDATWQIAATRHDGEGNELGRWTTPSFSSRPGAVSDGAGGIFLAWYDCRDCLGADGVYAIRLGPAVAPGSGWPADGVVVADSPYDDQLPRIVATGDGAAMISWLETGPLDRYLARRIEGDGTFASAWQYGGRAFAVSTDILSGWPLVVPDHTGGAIYAFRRNAPNLFGSRVDAFAQIPPAFPDTGLSLCSLSGEQFLASLVSDGIHGAYVLWEDRRAGGVDVDVYAMRFTRQGEVGATTSVEPPLLPPGIAMSAPKPNPSWSRATIDLTMPAPGHARIEVLDLEGRRLAVLVDAPLDADTHVLQWDGHDRERRLVPPGVYVVRARIGGAVAVRRLVRLP